MIDKISHNENPQDKTLSLLKQLWEITDDLVEFYPRYNKYTTAVFGSARINQDAVECRDAAKFAYASAKLGCNIITGGGPGIMEAASFGAFKAKTEDPSLAIKVIGSGIKLPKEQVANRYLDEYVLHKSFFTRLQHFVAVSDGFVAFYGGIGTVLEILTVLQLMQVHKIQRRKLILIGKMWFGLLSWFEKEMLTEDMQLIHSGDLLIPAIVQTYQEALELIKQHKTEINL